MKVNSLNRPRNEQEETPVHLPLGFRVLDILLRHPIHNLQFGEQFKCNLISLRRQAPFKYIAPRINSVKVGSEESLDIIQTFGYLIRWNLQVRLKVNWDFHNHNFVVLGELFRTFWFFIRETAQFPTVGTDQARVEVTRE